MLLICCTHYHNTAEVQAFIDHVAQLELPTEMWGHIVVTDNSQSIKNALVAPSRKFSVEVVTPGYNQGYLNGCALGWRTVCSQEKLPDWTLITNTDVRLDLDGFSAVIDREWRNDTGSVAPHILTADGVAQNPFYDTRPSKAQIKRLQWLFGHPRLAAVYRWLHYGRRNWVGGVRLPKQPTQIYAPHGSTILLRDVFFESGGCLEYGGFMYCEELHISEQLRRAKLHAAWFPSWTVKHFENKATERIAWSRRCRWHVESLKFIDETYFN